MFIVVSKYGDPPFCTEDLMLARKLANDEDAFLVIDTTDFTYAVPDDVSFTWKDLELVEED